MNTFKTIFAALAATAVLAGCAKEITSPSSENDKETPDAEGSRVITVAFAPQTKTELTDGFQPVFVPGDKILVANGQDEPDTCAVSFRNNKATIVTSLTGVLTAVYPAKAAKMDENKEKEIVGVLVSTEQDGTFASANICMAKMTDGNEESLSFENKTAVFCIKPAAGASPGYVEVSAEGFDIANYIPTGSSISDSSTIHVAPITTDSVYVSILVPNGLKVNNLKFSDGTQEKAITTGARATEAIKAGTLYTVTATGWESPEADIPDGALNGVFTVNAQGKQVHFSQGNLRYVVSGQKWEFYENQYSFCNTTTYDGHHADTVSLFTWGYNATSSTDPDGQTYVEGHTTDGESFDSTEDWGTQIGDGSTWRTLTTAEWQYLFNNHVKVWGQCNSVNGYFIAPDGYEGNATALTSAVTDWAPAEAAGIVFLPAAGHRNGSSVGNVGDRVRCWSSTAHGNDASYDVFFDSNSATPVRSDFRSRGYSVRLVTDVPASPGPTEPDYVVITAKYDGEDNPDRPLKWSRQNLAITDSGNKKWKGENDTAVKVPGTNEDVIVGDYFQWAAYAGYCGDATATDKGLLIYTSFTNRYLVSGGSEDKFEVKSNAEGKEYQFDTDSDDTYVGIAPYYSGSNFEYPSGSINLGKTDDVANIILGDDWRMPTSAEFKAMKDATYWAWDDDDEGYYVYIPVSGDEGGHNGKKSDTETDITGSYNKDNALLFFPAAGQGLNTDISGAHFFGYYWSSTFYLTHTYYAYNLYISESAVFPQHDVLRYSGLSVRPVSD